VVATPRGSARRDALSCAGVRYVLWRSRKRTPPAVPAGAYLFTVVLLLAFKALVLQAYGRPLVCPCGILGFWQGDPGAAGNSQLIADWYSASHLIFGILLFWLMWSTSRHWPTGWLFVSAAASSVLWEVIENTPAIIERFRHTELGRLYEGDSIANSMSDTVFVIAGFRAGAHRPCPLRHRAGGRAGSDCRARDPGRSGPDHVFLFPSCLGDQLVAARRVGHLTAPGPSALSFAPLLLRPESRNSIADERLPNA
jgi:hypothetical protein